MFALSYTWLGHSTFLFRSPGGKRILVDPWLETNPACPTSSKRIRELDLMLVTHGHADHASDAVPIARDTGALVIAPYELALWFERKGLKHVIGMNAGGSIDTHGLSISMVQAVHSSSVVEDGRTVDVGLAAGYVIRFENDVRIYFAGDTALFGDMKTIGELYRPSIAFLPIGDVYTMGPEQAARACELVGAAEVVPMHYGTFPQLTGTPARLRELAEPRGIRVNEMKPGETMG